MHLNSDNDAELLPEEQPTPSRALSKKTLARKPLPDGSRAQSLDIDRQTASVSERPRQQVTALDIQREDTSGQGPIVNARDNPTNTPMVAEARIPRPPVGQNPPVRAKTVSRKPLPTATSQSSIFTRESSQIDDSAKAFSITIIRRDPASGGQWNIGTVEGKSNPPHGGTMTKKPYYDISVHITTPGYNYFRHQTYPMGNNKLGATALSREPQDSNSKACGNEGFTSITQNPGASGTDFQRQVSMEWASSWNKTFKQHTRAISDFSTNHSRNSSGSSDGQHHFDPDNRLSEGSENSRAKGYTFLSPWGGTCTFSTSGAGRSLRCRHRLPAPVSADTLGSSSIAMTVSELRFNLPSADLFDREKMDLAAAQMKSGSSKLTQKLGSFRDKLSKPSPQPPSKTQPHQTSHTTMYASNREDRHSLPPRPSSISSLYEEDTLHLTQRLHSFLDDLSISNDNDDRLDLSIGQEKAGGGNSGNRAKLGKLIIHDEGLKMLDLIVAANIGVWWTIWNPN